MDLDEALTTDTNLRFSWYQTRFPSAHRIYERLRDFQEFHLGMLSVAVLGFGMVDGGLVMDGDNW